jgi:hypothetical protein
VAPVIDSRAALDRLSTPMPDNYIFTQPYALTSRSLIKLRGKSDTIIVVVVVVIIIIIIIIISFIIAFTNTLS